MKMTQRVLLYLGAGALAGLAALALRPATAFSLVALTLYFAAGYWAVYRPVQRAEQVAKVLRNSPGGALPKGDGALAGDILRCVEAERKQVEGLYSASVLDTQAQIGALQNQINPHFLYNTLEAIRGEAILNGSGDIASMAKALASFFRYSINRKEDIVTLLDELNNIKNYFVIQEYRFDNKFELEIQLEDEPEILGFYLPKLTVQPIVENAIFHGLETKPGKGRVTIRTFVSEGNFVLVISDDGVGMDEETLAGLRKKLAEGQVADGAPPPGTSPAGAPPPGQGNGIALSNVDQRLKLLFGAGYGMQVYSTPGIGTDVELRMPIVTDLDSLLGGPRV